MREIFVEQRKVLRLACYREQKFAILPTDPFQEKASKLAQQACDFGFDSITPLCKNCVWFQITDVSVHGRPAITDRKIEKSDVLGLATGYRESDVVDSSASVKIAQERAASARPFEA